jgi:hypothetical protein
VHGASSSGRRQQVSCSSAQGNDGRRQPVGKVAGAAHAQDYHAAAAALASWQQLHVQQLALQHIRKSVRVLFTSCFYRGVLMSRSWARFHVIVRS